MMKTFKEVLEESESNMSFNDAVTHAKKHGNRVVYGTQTGKWHSIDKSHKDYHTSVALDPDEAKRHGMAKSLLMSTQSRTMKEEYKVGDVVVPDKGPHAGIPHEVIHVHGNGQLNIRPKGMPVRFNKYRLGAATAQPNELRHHFDLKENRQTGINREVVHEAFKVAKEKKKTTKKVNKDKIEVKGPGVDDRFQKDPIVTPITTAYTKG